MRARRIAKRIALAASWSLSMHRAIDASSRTTCATHDASSFKGTRRDPSVLSRDRIGGVFGLERRHAAGQRQSVQLMPEHHKSLW
jgi:hypothetical protein